VGQLVGAISGAGELDPDTQDELLLAVARSQSAALDGLSEDEQNLEAVQRRDFAEGAVAALVQRLPASRQIEWLLCAQGAEPRLLTGELDRQDALSGERGLLSSHDARRLCDALLAEGQAREELAGWGPELELAARFPAEARDADGWRALLERASASGDANVSATASTLLGALE
jgi:hypothetical protein